MKKILEIETADEFLILVSALQCEIRRGKKILAEQKCEDTYLARTVKNDISILKNLLQRLADFPTEQEPEPEEPEPDLSGYKDLFADNANGNIDF